MGVYFIRVFLSDNLTEKKKKKEFQIRIPKCKTHALPPRINTFERVRRERRL